MNNYNTGYSTSRGLTVVFNMVGRKNRFKTQITSWVRQHVFEHISFKSGKQSLDLKMDLNYTINHVI